MRKTYSTVYATYGDYSALYASPESIPVGMEFEKFRNSGKAVVSMRNHCKMIYHDYTGGDYIPGTMMNCNVEVKAPDQAIAYVKGAYNKLTNEYGCGIVFSSRQGIDEYSFSEYDKYGMRHIAGELKAAQVATLRAVCLEITDLIIVYDYIGVEKLATCEWSANQPGTEEYQKEMCTGKNPLNLQFVKVRSHSGVVEYDRAETLAKLGCKIPGVINYGILE